VLSPSSNAGQPACQYGSGPGQPFRPGPPGRVDDGAGRYAAVLRDAGCTGVAMRQLDWRTWYGLPGHHMTLVAAAQPAG
jgi:hypothetical protein